MDITKTKNPREAAYLALLSSAREESFLIDSLAQWQAKCRPSIQDYHLAREVAYGTTRMALALDHLALQLADKKKLALKLREKILFRMGLYQFHYMDKIPLYAIVDETIKIAKIHCHESFVKFLNACLRKVEEIDPQLPKGETVPELSIRYSYPAYYVQELVQNFGLEKAEEIMEAGNRPSQTMFRVRPQASRPKEANGEIDFLAGTRCGMGVIRDPSLISNISSSSDYYIQNATPAELMSSLAQDFGAPKNILDLCSSPGGKLILAHDLYPDAELSANDVSSGKLKPLSENCAKYGISTTLSSVRGEEFPLAQKFDLVILDVPCSNTGVLNKRPEARWRLSQKTLEQLEEIQLQLLRRGIELLDKGGELWYLTCSVLKRENGRLIDKVCQELSLETRLKEAILPNADGWDGGFGCALRKIG
ncbi:putative ribosomal RNA small subunit methyltransferase B [Waddlia chondrophila 2032/99]|uniref:Putative ribosomal RNA small subunit methyltransferase B n=2 Tax=Waddlia chondrophila TaxID=71667 RepID=D6YTR0_WADCW|nr:transcription antitermination factor NusB [Waddlia chondrophila]ADI37521.1 putative ribosomal RNA small subunit methyltransferase B [Waddlia chondrophila WSU 86-1044]CCB90462.1 putative ribosomal RNA small subunit methyltransferase B [Waddlia chondrophila 2032/99]